MTPPPIPLDRFTPALPALPVDPLLAVTERTDTPDDFARIAERLQRKLKNLPPIEVEKLYGELRDLAVPSAEVRTFESVEQDLNQVSSYLDRATTIYLLVFRHAHLYSAFTGLLTEGWVKFSREKSEANRQGEARLKMAAFEEVSVEYQMLLKAVDRVTRNLENKHRALSEELECLGRMVRLSDFHQSGSVRTVSDSPEFAELAPVANEEQRKEGST